MSYLYSPSKDSFYPEKEIEVYRNSGSLPGDCFRVDLEIFQEFALMLAPSNKIRYWDGKKLIWRDRIEDKASQDLNERSWRNSELARSDIEINKIQDGSIKGSVTKWREYRKSLRVWPDSADFPNEKSRPIAPDRGI